MPASPKHPAPSRSGKALQDSEQDGAGTLPKPGKGAGASSRGGSLLPPAQPPCSAAGSAPGSPALGRPSSQRAVGSGSKLGKSLSEPPGACTASRLDLCASEITFQSLYKTQRSTGSEHLQPLRRKRG